MEKIVILSTDTTHHRFFINYLEKSNIVIQKYYFETDAIKPPFKVGPLYEKKQKLYEKKNFFKNTPYEINKKKIKYFNNLNLSKSIRYLEKIKPDLGIVFGTRKLSLDLIKNFRFGLINVHRGLPQIYRGLDSELWAVYNDDYKSICVTVHKIEKKLDTGTRLLQQRIRLRRNMRLFQLRYYMTLAAAKMVKKIILKKIYKKNNIKNYSSGKYYTFMPLNIKKIVEKKFNNYCRTIKN